MRWVKGVGILTAVSYIKVCQVQHDLPSPGPSPQYPKTRTLSTSFLLQTHIYSPRLHTRIHNDHIEENRKEEEPREVPKGQ